MGQLDLIQKPPMPSRRKRQVKNLKKHGFCIQFSGGRSSAMMLFQELQAHGGVLPENYRVCFQNTGREMPETLNFVRECELHWSVRIFWLEYRRRENKLDYEIVDYDTASRNGEPFDALIKAKKHLPNPATRFCTSDLKVKPGAKFMRDQGFDYWTSSIGFRADEPRRLEKMKNHNEAKKDRWDMRAPLAEAGISRRDVEAFWKERNFNLKLSTFDGTTPFGNCDGCFLKADHKKGLLYKHQPEKFAWWESWEEKTGQTFRLNCPLRDIREFVDAQGELALSQEYDLLCQADDGECV